MRGVWKRALPPGKYALNPYALKVELVPTVNFVLRWVTGVTESHNYDKDLKSIELAAAAQRSGRGGGQADRADPDPHRRGGSREPR